MKRLIMKTLTIFLLLVSIFIFTSSLTYSWFSPYIVQSHIIGKTREKYFQRGDGSSGDPFIISKASHFFNLSYLQNLGMFHDKVYHFKVADNQNNRTVIDFSSSKVLPIHRTIQPIGTEQYPFKGVFEGNNSVLKLYTVDGTGKQDIGTFGYVASGSKITNLFLDSPNIISNPLADIDTISFHNHNNLLNISTGFIVGHLCNEASVEYVYVVEPKITSLSNSFLNMTQHGLIGYNEADDGKIPLNASYSFSLNAVNAGGKIKQAITDDMFGNYIVDGTTTPLKNAISQNSQDVDINSPYSFSTIKIKENSTAPSKYLYDEMVSKDLVIGLDDKYFNRENIDLIGPISFKKAGIKDSTMDIHSSSTSFNIPMVGDESNPTKFTPTNYPNSIILYVRPTNDPTNLGKITANYDKGGGDLRYNSGWLNGIYQGGSVSQPVTFSQTGLEVTMSSFNAFTAVRVNKTTGEMTVVDSNPDFYVFLITVTNGIAKFISIDFNFTVTSDTVSVISKIDFIGRSEIDSLLLKENKDNYQYSYVNFGYHLIGTQKLNSTLFFDDELKNYYEFNFTYIIDDNSFFNIYIINFQRKKIIIKSGQTKYYEGTGEIITILVEKNNVIVT